MRNNQKAFTLVELLVVIGIIALLASILIPTVQKSFDKSDRLQTEMLVKQVAKAWKAHFNEYNEYVPPLTAAARSMSSPQVNRLTLRYFENDSFNPKKIIFLNEITTNLLDGSGALVDSWNNVLYFQFDHDFDGQISWGSQTIYDNYIVWSYGPDGANQTADDITSWGDD